MALTSLDLVNGALVRLGASKIQSFADGTRESDTAAIVYRRAIRYILTKGRFRCARAVMGLSADATFTQDAEKKYRFQLPPKFLSLLHVFDTDRRQTRDYVVRGNHIYSDLSALTIVYIRDVSDEGLITDEVGMAIEAYMAYLMSYTLTGSLPLKNQLFDEYLRAFAEADTADSRNMAQVDYVADADDQMAYSFLQSRIRA